MIDASVVVLGGSSGLGLATAQAALAAGAQVSIVGRNAEKVAAAAHGLGPQVRFAALDAGNHDELRSFLDSLDAIDHVVSFTGGQPAAPVAEADHDMFVSAMDSRVWAARNACAIAAPRMGPHGSFVFCSGVSSFRPRAGRSAGAVATAGLEAFTRAMAVELAPLRVNAVCPGAFDTEVLRKAFGPNRDEAMARVSAALPLRRIGQPEELAHAVLFLMTNTYTTGTVLHVDGGFALS